MSIDKQLQEWFDSRVFDENNILCDFSDVICKNQSNRSFEIKESNAVFEVKPADGLYIEGEPSEIPSIKFQRKDTNSIFNLIKKIKKNSFRNSKFNYKRR